jgi:hypothetical protein
MKNRWLCFVAVLTLGVAVHPSASAQDQSSARGNLGGLVYDTTKAVVPGAEVTITGPIGSLTQTTTQEGSFLFSTLIPGMYSIKVQKPGFKVANVKSAEVLINKTTGVEVTLEAGEVTQTVEVSAATVTVDTSSSSVNTGIADSFYQNIPVQRNVAGLFYLAPGAVDGQGTGGNNPSISGSTGLENAYIADGVSISDPAFGGLGVWSRSYGALGSGINLSFVKEVQVKSGGFEPQYGHASGGIVQIVTKSGGTETHGVVGGFYRGKWQQALQANGDDFGLVNQFGRFTRDAAYEGDFELGGYVPLAKLKNKLFYFGTFNPSWAHHYVAPAAGDPNTGAVTSGLFTIYNGSLDRQITSYDYAGKLTYRLGNGHTLEGSVFGDPSHTNSVPWATLNAPDTTVNSKWDFGTRNLAARYDGAFGTSLIVDVAFTYAWNHFTETPQSDVTQIIDSSFAVQPGTFTAQGFGLREPYDSNTKGVTGDISKTVRIFGLSHTFTAGYTWQFPTYNDITHFSGGYFTIPSANATGGDPGYLNCPSNPTCGVQVAGKQVDAALTLELASSPAPPTAADAAAGWTSSCHLCPFLNGQQVVLQQGRGRFDGGVTRSSGKYHAAYVNDAWSMGKHATLNLGLRWEQQRLVGNKSSKLFNDMWSPRVGFTVDPKGDRKSKIYANFGRYAFVLPLDAAVRELSSEYDFLNPFWAPASGSCTGSEPGGATCIATTNGTPSYSTMFVPDQSHLLNLATGGIGKAPTISISGGEPFQPGVRMEYTDEFVVGADHEFKGGIIASARYIDRRLKRVIEDEGGISVEQFIALASNGGGLNYFIGNPNSQSDIFVNPNEITFSKGATFIAPADAAGNTLPLNAANRAAYEKAGMPGACFDANGNPTPYVAFNVLVPTFPQTPAGSACFPAVNTNTWTNSSGNLLSDCSSLAQSKQPGGCAAFGGEFYADGKPDTYKDPKREYQAVEFEVNKSFSHNWALVANWRIARLQGNYEGAFRNDNTQADPGISSLFDLTEGAFGLLAQQQGLGQLNTDRRHVVNVYSTYVLDRTRMKGLTLGSGFRLQSGVPLTTLFAQYAYQNAGEVPWFGRGDLGRAPVVGTVDAHAEYPLKLTERMSLKFGFDAFNIGNTKRTTLVNQFGDQGFGIPNADFSKPGGGAAFSPDLLAGHFFTYPFNSRFSLRLVF